MNNYRNIRYIIMRNLLSLIALLISVQSVAQSQDQTLPDDNRKSDERIISYSVFAVLVQIEVTDREGKEVADLTKDDFIVYEDGVQQELICLMRNTGTDRQTDQPMYELGYYPPNFRFEGEWRKIRVSVRSKDEEMVRTQFAPRGYYAYKAFFK